MYELSCGVCPKCKENGVVVRMIYDPQRDECYCPVCGYSEPAYTPVLPVPKENDVQMSIVSIIDNDKGLGGYTSNAEIQKIVEKMSKKKISKERAAMFKVGLDTKTFKEMKTDIERIINCIENEYDIRIPKYVYNDTIYYTGKIIKRSPDVNKGSLIERHYRILEIFLAVLYHIMVSTFLHLHRNEILDMITSCAEDFDVEYEGSKNVLRTTISRRHGRIKHMLPRYNISLIDKIRAVADRYKVPYEIALDFFDYVIKKIDPNKYNLDNLVFAGIYFIREEIMREPIKDENKILRSGIRTVYLVLQNIVPQMIIDSLRRKYMKLKRSLKN